MHDQILVKFFVVCCAAVLAFRKRRYRNRACAWVCRRVNIFTADFLVHALVCRGMSDESLAFPIFVGSFDPVYLSERIWLVVRDNFYLDFYRIYGHEDLCPLLHLQATRVSPLWHLHTAYPRQDTWVITRGRAAF